MLNFYGVGKDGTYTNPKELKGRLLFTGDTFFIFQNFTVNIKFIFVLKLRNKSPNIRHLPLSHNRISFDCIIEATRLHPFFPFPSCSFGLLHSRIFSTPSSWVCSSKAREPLAPNFYSWVTRKSLFFHTNYMLGILDFTGSEHWAPFNFP